MRRAWHAAAARPRHSGQAHFDRRLTEIPESLLVEVADPCAAGIEFPVHPHMLRHATGFYLANAGQDTRAIQLYLGHKNIQHTVRYTELAAGRFKDFWRD
jgi:site-specific recombinase XerD